MKFEWTWTLNKLNIEITDFCWDTMLAAHVIDNRPYITSIKFLAYIYFGVIDYNSEIEPYLKGVDEKNANSMNRILELTKTEAGRTKLLTYCGMDSIFEYRAAMKQMEELK
jgi:hypothetical protein